MTDDTPNLDDMLDRLAALADPITAPDVATFLRRLIDDTDTAMATEDANQPHVAIVYDTECPTVADGISCVRGPFPSAADAMLAAVTWADELASDGSDGWQPMIARLYDATGH